MNNRLRVMRAERGWTQEQLGSHVGVSRQAINAIETGRYDPSLPLAFRISRVFGLAIEQVFLPDDEPDPAHRADRGGVRQRLQ